MSRLVQFFFFLRESVCMLELTKLKDLHSTINTPSIIYDIIIIIIVVVA